MSCELGGRFKVEVGDVQQTLGQTRLLERALEALCRERRLRRRLEHHRITSEQRGDEAVDGGEVRIVPRRHDAHHAERIAADSKLEVGRLGLGARRVGQALFRHLAEVSASLERALDLAGALRGRSAHLLRELLSERLLVRIEQRHPLGDDRHTLLDAHLGPRLLRCGRSIDGLVELGSREQLLFAHDALVVGRDSGLDRGRRHCCCWVIELVWWWWWWRGASGGGTSEKHSRHILAGTSEQLTVALSGCDPRVQESSQKR